MVRPTAPDGASGGTEQRAEGATSARDAVEEPLGQRRERRPREPVRPLAPPGERPQAHEERGRPDPHVPLVTDDDELRAQPGHRAVSLLRLLRAARQELERKVGRLFEHPRPTPNAERAELFLEDGQRFLGEPPRASGAKRPYSGRLRRE